jgi:5,10-methylenetetrahydromethanopterin reductase
MMRECIMGIRTLLAGEEYSLIGHPLTLQFREQIFSWELPAISSRKVPIYLGGRGPKMTRLAGELADGLLIELCVPPVEIPERTGELHVGAEQAGRDPSSLEVACNIHTTVTSDGELDEQLREHIAGWYATRVPDSSLERTPLDVREVEHIRSIVESQGRRAAAAFVTRPMIQNLCAAGTPDECLNKLFEYQAAGVTHAILMPFGGDPYLAIQVGVEFKRRERIGQPQNNARISRETSNV